MALSRKQINDLEKIIAMAQKLIDAHNGDGQPVRRRRSAAETEKMRAEVLAKKAKGVPAAKLAEKYGVSTAYIYMIK